MKLIIAIDGNAASGKGTLARNLAEHFNAKYLPTGNLYRVVAKQMLENSIVPENIEAIKQLVDKIEYSDLLSNNLQTSAISSMASKIATIESVRNALFSFQRDWANNNNVAILEGRDIGTVICPEADVKIFLTANLESRAERRLKDFVQADIETTYEKVYHELKERDFRDSNRDIAPLLKSKDAIEIDSSSLSSNQVLLESIKIIEKQIDKKS